MKEKELKKAFNYKTLHKKTQTLSTTDSTKNLGWIHMLWKGQLDSWHPSCYYCQKVFKLKSYESIGSVSNSIIILFSSTAHYIVCIMYIIYHYRDELHISEKLRRLTSNMDELREVINTPSMVSTFFNAWAILKIGLHSRH